jgi:hypothetical protein
MNLFVMRYKISKIDKECPQYRDLKKFVLHPAHKEIIEKTDIEYDFTEKNRGRKVIGLVFDIRRNAASPATIPQEPSQPKPEQTEEAPVSPGVAQLMGLGVARKAAQALAKEFSEEQIRDKIAYAQAQQQEGKVKNLAGFVVEAIRSGYLDSQAEEQERKRKQASAAALKAAKLKEWERMKSVWNAWRIERVQAFIATMDAETLAREKAAFRESLKGSVMAKTIKSNPDSEERHFRIHITGQMAGLGMADWAQATEVDMEPFKELARMEGKI